MTYSFNYWPQIIRFKACPLRLFVFLIHAAIGYEFCLGRKLTFTLGVDAIIIIQCWTDLCKFKHLV